MQIGHRGVDLVGMRRRATIPMLAALCALPGCDTPKPTASATPSVRPAPARSRVVGEHCTIVWSGPIRGGRWHDPANWSKARLPGPRDQACIPRGQTVVIARGSQRVGSVLAGGGLTIERGSLELVDTFTTTEIGYLTVRQGATFVHGPSDVDVTLGGTIDGMVRGGTGTRPAAGPAIPCGVHSPPGVSACRPAPDPAKRAAVRRARRTAGAGVRRAWRQLLQELRAGEDGEAVASLLGPDACMDKGENPPRTERDHLLDCRYMIRYELTLQRIASMSDTLDHLSIRGGTAEARLLDGTAVTFARRHGRWLVWWFNREGPQ